MTKEFHMNQGLTHTMQLVCSFTTKYLIAACNYKLGFKSQRGMCFYCKIYYIARCVN